MLVDMKIFIDIDEIYTISFDKDISIEEATKEYLFNLFYEVGGGSLTEKNFHKIVKKVLTKYI